MASSDRIRLSREQHRVRCAPARPRAPRQCSQPAPRSRGAVSSPSLGSPETDRPVGRQGRGHRVGSYWASRALSLSSFPHSQSFPGSTAKCRGNSLCSESVRGITAGTQKRETRARWLGGGDGRLEVPVTPREDRKRPPRPGVSMIEETEWSCTQDLYARRGVKARGVKRTTV